MALTNCPECSHDVSTSALHCPNCGHPMASKSQGLASNTANALRAILGVAFIVGGLVLAFNDSLLGVLAFMTGGWFLHPLRRSILYATSTHES